ncbi:MAG: glycosyltransferase [Desulfobacteraceae bacterium]|nr:glycosyltransferase [Desulfobacteraceae bacterium]
MATSQEYQKARQTHWDNIASCKEAGIRWGDYYHQRLTQIYQFLVAPGQKVIEIGCGTGDLLSALKPAPGVGIDFSGQMIKHARQKYREMKFIQCDAHDLDMGEKFDVIILSDLVNDLWDVQTVFNQISKKLATPESRIIINTYSRLWEIPLKLAQQLGLMTSLLPQNWLTVEDVAGLLDMTDFEVIRHHSEILWPLHLPLLGDIINSFAAKLLPFRYFTLTNFIIARPRPVQLNKKPIVSVIVPARNEAGNISRIFETTPEMGQGTELVFVEGHSDDNTFSVIEKAVESHPDRKCKLLQQTGVGKGDAVRLGFANADGEILMILDADLTVPPEYLPRFYEALVSGKGEFINGVRLVYPMEKQAMRYLNLIGNKFFSLAFSWLLGQPVKDTLCGTKVLWKSDYERIADNRAFFGDFDPFGDFDLLFGAAKLNLKIVEMPLRYAERTYGNTNIRRWSHGWLLLRMVMFAAGRIKFV